MSQIEVTVQSLLPSHEPQGRFCLHLSPQCTVENLLIQLCTDSGTSLKPDYVLQSTKHNVLDRRATLSEAGREDCVFLYWTTQNVDTYFAGCCRTAVWVAGATLVLGLVGIVTVCIVRFKDVSKSQQILGEKSRVDVETFSMTSQGQPARKPSPTGTLSAPKTFKFAVVFDAGSTHTSMFVYTWEAGKFHGTAVAIQFGKECLAKGNGIAAFENDPQNAGDSLELCLDEAIAAIPAWQHPRTPVYLGATAGMRLLRQRNISASDAILDSVRATLSRSPFLFNRSGTCARILTGSEEGTFSWITSNYVANAFKVNRPDIADIQEYTIVPSIGAMDLGGASAQITFVPEGISEMPRNYSRQLQLFGKHYTVYTHSYLCYGVQEMSRQIFAFLIMGQPGVDSLDHPCLPSGYNLTHSHQQIFDSVCVPVAPTVWIANYTFVGSSNKRLCSVVVRAALFNFSSCSYTTCSFNGIYQPPVSGPFYAFSSFYYVSTFLNLSESNSSSFQHRQFEQAIDRLCSSSWAELQQVNVSKKEEQSLMFYCTQSNYINLLLSEGFNFTDTKWKAILFVGKVSGTSIGWSLGFVLNESNGYASALNMTSLTFTLLVAFFSGLVILALVVLIDAQRAHHLHTSRRSAPNVLFRNVGKNQYSDACPVCGDKVNGFHYGILTCEACKSFFKTYTRNKKIDSCMADGNCQINKTTRRCRFCRFQKCIMVGMKFEAVKKLHRRGGTGKFASFYREARYTYQQTARRDPHANISQPTNGAMTESTAEICETNTSDPSTASNVSESIPGLQCVSVTPLSSYTVLVPPACISSSTSAQPRLTKTCEQHPHLLRALSTPQLPQKIYTALLPQ